MVRVPIFFYFTLQLLKHIELTKAKKYIQVSEKVTEITGNLISWFTLLLVILVSADVILRYAFQVSFVAVQELELHLFAAIFLGGAAWTFKYDDHVRVDIFYSKLSERGKALINILGILFFLIPFAVMIIYSSMDFAINSYLISERSPDPGGLPMKYIVKAIIPFSFFLLLIQAFSSLVKSFIRIFQEDK